MVRRRTLGPLALAAALAAGCSSAASTGGVQAVARTGTLAGECPERVVGVAGTQPMTAVLAPLNGDPQVLIWDPVTHPEFTIVQDVGQTDAKVVYSGNAQTVFGYLTGSGILRSAQLDAARRHRLVRPARAQLEDWDRTRESLLTARAAAPEHVAAHPEVRALLDEPSLRTLAEYMGRTMDG